MFQLPQHMFRDQAISVLKSVSLFAQVLYLSALCMMRYQSIVGLAVAPVLLPGGKKEK